MVFPFRQEFKNLLQRIWCCIFVGCAIYCVKCLRKMIRACQQAINSFPKCADNDFNSVVKSVLAKCSFKNFEGIGQWCSIYWTFMGQKWWTHRDRTYEANTRKRKTPESLLMLRKQLTKSSALTCSKASNHLFLLPGFF